MDSVLVMIFLLSFVSVTTEEQREVDREISFPDVLPAVRYIENVDGRRKNAKNDDMFWEVTRTPSNENLPVVVDGNHPNNYEITTHDHVDQIIGNVPFTKRVKKILPPFEGTKLRSARHIESSFSEKFKITAEEIARRSVESSSAPRDTAHTFEVPKSEDAAIGGFENATESLADTSTLPNTEDEIQGIRLVPNEFGTLSPRGDKVRQDGEEREEEDEEEPAMQKSIWELLKEREQFNADSTHLDGMETSGNETDATIRPPAKNIKSSSLYEHFDADSAEVEFETENFNVGSNIEKHELPISYAMPWLQVKDKQFDGSGKRDVDPAREDIPQDVSKLLKLTQNRNSLKGMSVSVINSVGGDYLRYGRRPSKWYLLLLTGNSTIVKLRRQDFTKYLKLNLAARLSVEYDDVKVNKVILAPPKVLVNISVFAPSDDVAEESQLDFKVSDKGEAPLYKLAETNATLLELSGEEYHVFRFLSLESQKPEAEAHKNIPNTVSMTSRQNDVEFIIYTFLGSACACAVLLSLFVTLNRYCRKMSDFAWSRPKSIAWETREDDEQNKEEFDGISPAVIYSGGFPQIRGSWMTGVGQVAAVPPFRQQCPSFEIGGSPPRRKASVYPDFEVRPCASPRHSKLQIYNCDADSLVIPMPVRIKATEMGQAAESEGRDTRPLDVRIPGEKTGQDNPIFTN